MIIHKFTTLGKDPSGYFHWMHTGGGWGEILYLSSLAIVLSDYIMSIHGTPSKHGLTLLELSASFRLLWSMSLECCQEKDSQGYNNTHNHVTHQPCKPEYDYWCYQAKRLKEWPALFHIPFKHQRSPDSKNHVSCITQNFKITFFLSQIVRMMGLLISKM